MSTAALLCGLKTRHDHRKWRATATVLALIVVVATFAWFVPNIMILAKGGEGMNAGQITSLTNWWVRLNWVRVVIYSAAWLAGLRAMTIPASSKMEI